MRLSDMKEGEKALVHNLDIEDFKLKKRLMDLGMVKGREIEVKGFAPLGDPMLIQLMDTKYAIRKDDASQIIMREIEHSNEQSNDPEME